MESAHNNPADLFSTFDRATLASVVEVLIAVLDAMDGEADFEGSCDEDEISTSFRSVRKMGGPGCALGDPDAAIDDFGCDDINDDREHEWPCVPSYGIDQTQSPINPREMAAQAWRDDDARHRAHYAGVIAQRA